MTLGEFRAMTQGLPDSAPIVAPTRWGDYLRLAKAKACRVVRLPGGYRPEYIEHGGDGIVSEEAVVVGE